MSFADTLEASAVVAASVFLWGMSTQVRRAGRGNRKDMLLTGIVSVVSIPFVVAGMLVADRMRRNG